MQKQQVERGGIQSNQFGVGYAFIRGKLHLSQGQIWSLEYQNNSKEMNVCSRQYRQRYIGHLPTQVTGIGGGVTWCAG